MSGFTLSYTANIFILIILYYFSLFPAQFEVIQNQENELTHIVNLLYVGLTRNAQKTQPLLLEKLVYLAVS
jgi:hypothetical protein